MVFNWFRRQFSDRSQEPEVEDTEQAQEQPEVEPAASEATQEQSQEVAADYLNWAKAAYKNIQQQQSQVEEAPTQGEESPTEDLAQKPAVADMVTVPETATEPAETETAK